MFPLADAALAGILLAADGVVDTSYGRIDGDSALVASIGAAFDVRGVRGSVDVRYRYLQSVGLFLTYEEGFGAGSEPVRLGVAGLELRPVFLARFLQGSEIGKARLDLLIDSIAIELGPFVGQPYKGSFGDTVGLSLGFGVELPLLPQANGPFIAVRAALRWSREALSAADTTTVDQRAFVVTVAFGWQGILGTHAVDLGDTRH
jgi:hypothetical protein